MIDFVKATLDERQEKRNRGSFLLEGLIVLAIAIVGCLIWWPISKAERLASGERQAAKLMLSLATRLPAAKDLRDLAAGSSSPDGGGFHFHTENIAERDGYLFRFTPKLEGASLYAWPVLYGKTGNAAFILDPPRPLLETRNHRRRYSGLRRQPGEKAGLPAGTEEATASFGKDAQEWKPFVDRDS